MIEIHKGFLCLFSILILIEALLFCLKEHRFYVPKRIMPFQAQSLGQQMQVHRSLQDGQVAEYSHVSFDALALLKSHCDGLYLAGC